MGTMGVAILVNPADGSPQTPDDPFTSILESLMDVGGFAEAVACIGITASLAAIMSTADSLIIAISQLLTVEIFYPMMPSSTPKKMAWYGRLSSVLAVALALAVGLAWDEGITDLGKIQFPLTCQVIPPFLIGLFAKNKATDVHPWCLVAAMASSSIYVVAIYFGYLRGSSNPVAIDSGITGVVIQVVLIGIFESTYRLIGAKHTAKEEKPSETALLYPGRPSWDVPKMSRFGVTTLSPELVWKSMKGFYEPMTNVYWTVLMFLSISLTTPMVAPNEPPLNGDEFLYLPYTIDGLPWWAFKTIILCIIPFVILLAAIYNIPNDFPMEKESAIAKKGVDVDLVSLTPKEMGRRSSYDEQNVLIYQRRSTITSTMQEMGIQQEESVEEVTPSNKRLSSLVYALDLDVDLVKEDDDAPEAAKEEVVDA